MTVAELIEELKKHDGDLHDAAELYGVAESSDEANLQIRRLLNWSGAPNGRRSRSTSSSTQTPKRAPRRFKEKTKMIANDKPIKKSREL